MSRAQEYQTNTKKNPVKKYLEWSSSEKAFNYYDKDAKQKVYLPLPTKFIVLTQTSTLGGFSDEFNCGLFATEAKYFDGNEKLTLKTMKSGLYEKTGTYKELKGDKGAKFKKNVYAVLDGELVCIQLVGCALTYFLGSRLSDPKDATSKVPNVDAERLRFLTEYVAVTTTIAGKKGATKYNSPDYEFAGEISAEDNELAEVLYAELLDYKEGLDARDEHDEEASSKEAEAIKAELSKEESEIPF